MEHYDQVQRAYDELVADGSITVVPPTADPATVDNQKAYFTRRAGYYLNQVDSGYGLLSKTSGNNVQGLSVDFILHKPEGTGYDIATDAEVPGGRMVKPINAGGSVDASLLPRWVQPTKAMAGLENGGTNPPPDGTVTTDEIMAKLDEMQAQLFAIQNSQHQQDVVLAQHTQMLQTILDKPTNGGGKFPIIYPQYVGRLLGFTIALSPQPPMNP